MPGVKKKGVDACVQPGRAHAVLSPSAAARWLSCPPSVRLGEWLAARTGEQPKTSEAAELGTRAHALGELKIRRALYELDRMTPEKFAGLTNAEQVAYQGIDEEVFQRESAKLGAFDDDVLQATDTYMDVVMERYEGARRRDPSAELLLEVGLSLDRWVPESFGSADCVIITAGKLAVLDYKNGKSPVEVKDNPQIRLYALGVLAKFDALYDFDTVEVGIIQPRVPDGVAFEEMEVADLLTWGEKIQPIAKMAFEGLGEFKSGPHCKYCPVGMRCARRISDCMALAPRLSHGAQVIHEDQVAEIMAALPVLQDVAKEFRSYWTERACSGASIPGCKLVRGKAKDLTWDDEKEAEKALRKAGLTLNEIKPRVFKMTPTRAKEVLKKSGRMEKNVAEAWVAERAHRAESDLELVLESDKRQAYSSAQAAFGDLVE